MPDQDIRAYACFVGEKLVGGWTLRRVNGKLLKAGIKPWATYYCGGIIHNKARAAAQEIFDAMIHYLRQHFDVLQSVHGPSFRYLSLYQQARFKLHQRSTLLFATDTEDTMWQRISHHARNAARRAKRESVQVVQITDAAILSRLYWSSYARQGLPINFSPKQLEGICEDVLAAGRGELWAALDIHDRPCCVLLVGWDNKRAYGVLSGTDDQYNRNGAGSLMWWEVFRALAPRFQEMDMVGSGTPGIHRFKMQFKPSVVPVHETLGFRSGRAQLVWNVRQALIRIRNRVRR